MRGLEEGDTGLEGMHTGFAKKLLLSSSYLGWKLKFVFQTNQQKEKEKKKEKKKKNRERERKRKRKRKRKTSSQYVNDYVNSKDKQTLKTDDNATTAYFAT